MPTIDALLDAYESRRLSRREHSSPRSPSCWPVPARRHPRRLRRRSHRPPRDVRLNHASLAVSDVAASADFYSRILGLNVVSRPGNGGINLGLGDGFLGVYKLANPSYVNHICIGVDDFDPERIAAKLKEMGIAATIDRNPANRTSGGNQLYFNGPDNCRIQLGARARLSRLAARG